MEDFGRINRIYRIGIVSRGDAEARGIGELGCLTQRRREAESAEDIWEL